MRRFDTYYRVILSDTDAGGIVYHANYLEMAERGRNEAMRDIGIMAGSFAPDIEYGFVVRGAELSFHSPSFVDDWLTIRTRLKYLSRAKSCWETQIIRDQQKICTIDLSLVCINRTSQSACYFVPQIYKAFQDIASVV